MSNFLERAKGQVSPRALAITSAVTIGTLLPNALIVPSGFGIWEATMSRPDILVPIAVASMALSASLTGIIEYKTLKKKDMTTNAYTNIFHILISHPVLAVGASAIFCTFAGLVLDPTLPAAGAIALLNGSFSPIVANLIAKSAILGVYGCTMNLLLLHDKIDNTVDFIVRTEKRVHSAINKRKKSGIV